MTKRPYTIPALSVVEFRNERGFAISQVNILPPDGMLELIIIQEQERQESEVFVQRSGWTDDSENTFWTN